MSIFNSNDVQLATADKLATIDAGRRAQEFLDQHYGGQDSGACGFAWVTYYPEYKGNTSLGKLERKLIESIGFRKDYTGKAWQKWNPSNSHCQNIDAKFTGAQAYAETLFTMAGVKVSPGDRMD